MSKQRMKIMVRIPAITLEVDIQGWAIEYGPDPSEKAVREDVRAYFNLANFIPDHLSEIVTIPDRL